LPEQWKNCIIVPVYKNGDTTELLLWDITFINFIIKFCPAPFSQGELHMQLRLLGIISVGFNTTNHICCICQILEKKWEYDETVHQLFIDFKKGYDSVGREVLSNILIKSGVPIQMVRQIKMSLNEMYSEVRLGKYVSVSYLKMV
jgi:hypothetical protein